MRNNATTALEIQKALFSVTDELRARIIKNIELAKEEKQHAWIYALTLDLLDTTP